MESQRYNHIYLMVNTPGTAVNATMIFCVQSVGVWCFLHLWKLQRTKNNTLFLHEGMLDLLSCLVIVQTTRKLP